MIYRYYDQAALDRQYNARATVDDFQAIVAGYAERARAAQARLPCALGLRYGATEPERLDIYPAATSGPAPVWVFVHGGYWRMLDAADSGFMAEAFTRAGIAVVALNYALAPGAALDEIVRQCRAGLGWVWRHIGDFGGDPGRLHVGGSSAGAHLAAMLAADGWAETAGLPGDVIRSATLMSGLYDLEPVRLAEPNQWLRLDAGAALRNSPLHRLPRPGMDVIVTYAPTETDEFKRQSEVYLAAAQAAGCRARFVPASGTNHFDIVFELCRPDSPLAQAVTAAVG